MKVYYKSNCFRDGYYILIPHKKMLYMHHSGWGETFRSQYSAGLFRNARSKQLDTVVIEAPFEVCVFTEIPEADLMLEQI